MSQVYAITYVGRLRLRASGIRLGVVGEKIVVLKKRKRRLSHKKTLEDILRERDREHFMREQRNPHIGSLLGET